MFFFFGDFESYLYRLLKPWCTNKIIISINLSLDVKENNFPNCQMGPIENNIEC